MKHHIDVDHHHHYHISVMRLGHLLSRSGLTYPEVSSKVCHDSFCHLDDSVSLLWVTYYEAFHLHVVQFTLQILYTWLVASNASKGIKLSILPNLIQQYPSFTALNSKTVHIINDHCPKHGLLSQPYYCMRSTN